MTISKTYSTLFIDWDDTIGDFSGASARSLREMYFAFGLDRCYDSPEAFRAVYEPHNIELWERYGRDEVTKDYLEFDRFFYPLMLAPRPLPVAEAASLAPRMAAEHLRHTTEYFAPIPGAVETIQTLAKKYRIIVVSNGFESVQYVKIDRSGLRDCFADIVLSEQIGCQKPNPEFFRLALSRNHLRPDEVLMIGDSWYSDIFGAREAGIDQMWIIGDGTKRREGQTATYEVTDILAVRASLA